jgi:hypothetical protein
MSNSGAPRRFLPVIANAGGLAAGTPSRMSHPDDYQRLTERGAYWKENPFRAVMSGGRS